MFRIYILIWLSVNQLYTVVSIHNSSYKDFICIFKPQSENIVETRSLIYINQTLFITADLYEVNIRRGYTRTSVAGTQPQSFKVIVSLDRSPDVDSILATFDCLPFFYQPPKLPTDWLTSQQLRANSAEPDLGTLDYISLSILSTV